MKIVCVSGYFDPIHIGHIEYFKKSNVTEEKVERFNSTLKLDVHTFKILLPGRLTKWKGQEMFLEAIKLLKTKY